jgi:hypothetical protein
MKRYLFCLIAASALIISANAQNTSLKWQQGVYGGMTTTSAMHTVDIDGDLLNEVIVGNHNCWYIMRYDPQLNDYVIHWMSRYYSQTAMLEVLELYDYDEDNVMEIVVASGDGLIEFYDPHSLTVEDSVRLPGYAYTPQSMDFANADSDSDTELIIQTLNKTYIYSRESGSYQLEYSFYERGGKVKCADVDGDTQPELVFTNGKLMRIQADTLALVWQFFDNIYGTFGIILLEDVDNDGLKEIILADNYTNMGVYDADVQQAKWERDVGKGIDAMIMADTDGDGIRELVYGEDQWGSIISLNPLDGEPNWSLQNPDHGVAAINVADTDNDGAPELLWADGSSSSGATHKYVYSLPERAQEWVSLHLTGPFTQIAITDVDDDSEPEIVTLTKGSENSGSGIITVFNAITREREWQSTPELMTFMDNWEGNFAMEIIDVDGDNETEIIIAGGKIYSGAMWVINGATHELESSYVWPYIYNYGTFFDIDVADINNDGALDYIATSNDYVYAFNSSDYSTIWTSERFESYSYTKAEAANIDNDPNMEIICAHNKITVYDLITNELWETGNLGIYLFDLFDMDGDGIPEIVAGTYGGKVAVINGISHEVTYLPIQLPNRVTGIKVGNITGDDEPEIVLMCEGVAYFSKLDGTMVRSEQHGYEGEGRTPVEICDYDNNGVPGIFIGTWIKAAEFDPRSYACMDFQASVTAEAATCFAADGTASVIAQNGFEPYSYAWSSGDTTAEVTTLATGEYSVTVTDRIGCVFTETVIVPMTDPFVIDNVQTFPDNSNTTLCEGMARIFPANGLPPYHYIVEEDTLSMVGDNIPDLCSGTYNLTVMDSNGCSEVIQFEIENNLGLGEPLIHPYRIYPVPASDAVYVEFIKTDHTKAFAEIRNLQGRKILVSDLEDQITRLDIVDLPPGIYILHIEADEERSDFRIIKLK